MPWWTWLAIGVLLAVAATAAGVAAVLALRAFRALRTAQATLLEAAARLAEDADALARRAERTTGRLAEIEDGLGAVRRSTERLGVLRWALGDSLGAAARLRRAVPRK